MAAVAAFGACKRGCDVKRRLADAQLKREIRRLEKENSEHEATHVLMQLNGAAGSSTSSLSSPDS